MNRLKILIAACLIPLSVCGSPVTLTNVTAAKCKQYVWDAGYTNHWLIFDDECMLEQITTDSIEITWNHPVVPTPDQANMNSITNADEWVYSMRPTRAMEQSLTNHVQGIVLLLNTIPSPPFDTLTLEPPYPSGTRQTLAALAEAASNIFTNQEDKIRLNSLSVFAVMEMFSLHEDGVETDNNADLGK